MKPGKDRIGEQYTEKLKILMLLRLLFSSLLLGSLAFVQYRERIPASQAPVLSLYLVIGLIFFFSIMWAIGLQRTRNIQGLAEVQIIADTVIVSVIIYITGNYSSIFSFLYLLVIIYSSIFLEKRKIIMVCALCGIQYGLLLWLEYLNILPLERMGAGEPFKPFFWARGFYKAGMITFACFLVGFLSSFLSEQERRSAERLKVVEERLKRIEKMAAMGELAANMAHEIKNPLASMTGAVQLLREHVPKEPRLERLMMIVLKEGRRLEKMVSDFLLFSRPVQGRSVRIDLEKAVAEIVALFEKDRTVGKRIKISVSCEKNLYIYMDSHHFKQVLWNLLLNAAEAIEGRGLIKVETRGSTHKAVLTVSDTGCGIQGDADKIFDPFYTTKTGGSGLGLSIVHRVLSMYDAWIDLVGREDGLTSFRIIFNRESPGSVHMG